MPTYLELVEKVAKLEAMTDSMPSRAESEQTIHADDPSYFLFNLCLTDIPFVSAAVLFTAYSAPERVDYYAGDQLRFDAVITNVGGAYDPDTCKFVSCHFK